MRVYAVCFDMLVADNRGTWNPDTMPDSRVTHLWDLERQAGCRYAEHSPPSGFFGGPIIWDAYYLYGPEARWDDDDVPKPLIGSGYTIMAKRKALAKEIAPLLGQSPQTPDESVRFVGKPLSGLDCPSEASRRSVR